MSSFGLSRALLPTSLAVALLVAGCGKKAPLPPKPPVPVLVGKAEKRTVPEQIRVVGLVNAFRTVNINAQIQGQIQKLHFNEGQMVKEGDLLVTINPEMYKAKLAQAEGQLAADLATAQTAERDLVRYTSLIRSDSISPENYDKQLSTAESAKAQVKADEAEVDQARINLDYCSIRSPITGIIGEYLVDIGNLVNAYESPSGQPGIAVVNQVQPVYVTFGIPEQYYSDVAKYLPSGKCTVEAIPRGTGEKPEVGELTFRNNTVDDESGMLTLRGTFENKDLRLWPGQFVEVFLNLTEKPDLVVVPYIAVTEGPTGRYVYVLQPDNTVRYQAVTTGERVDLGNSVVVLDGLKGGETVITDGQFMLAPGSKVMVQKSLQSAAQELMQQENQQHAKSSPAQGDDKAKPAKPTKPADRDDAKGAGE